MRKPLRGSPMMIWLANMGGYDANPHKRPPGATVIMRGLEYLAKRVEGAELRETSSK